MSNSNQIQQNAQNPASASTDGTSASQFPLEGQIAADRYAAAANARRNKNRGLMFTKLLPAGPMPDQQGTGFGATPGLDVPPLF